MKKAPRIDGKSDQILVLEVNLPRHPVEHNLVCAVCGHRKRALLHPTNAANGRADCDELARPMDGFLKQ